MDQSPRLSAARAVTRFADPRASAIPDVQALTISQRPSPQERQAAQEAKHFPRGIRPQLAARGQHRFSQHNETALTMQSTAHDGFLGGEQSRVESTDSVECLLRAEEKTTARQPSDSINRTERNDHQPGPEWQSAVEAQIATPTDGPVPHGVNSRPNDRRVHDGVRVDEDEEISLRLARPELRVAAIWRWLT